MLDEAGLLQILILAHWVGMVVALATVATADGLGVGILLTRMRGRRGMFTALHHIIAGSLFLLLFSGGALIALRMPGWCALDPATVVQIAGICIPNKLVAKLLLIGVLVTVALLIDTYVLPLSRRPERPLLPHLSRWQVARSAMIGSASLTCWTSLAAIPLIKDLHLWPVTDLLVGAGIIWAGLSACLVAGLLVLRAVFYRQEYRPAAEPAGSQGWHTHPQVSLATFASHVAAVHETEHETRRRSRRTSSDAPTDAPHQPITVEGAFAACRQAVLGNAAISFVINVLMLAGPLYMLQVYDRVLTSRSLETLTVLTGLLIGLYVFLGVLDVIRTRILSRIALRLDRLLGPGLLAGAVGMSNSKSGGAEPQPMRDLEQIRQFVSGPAPAAIFDLPWAPLYIVLIFLLHPVLGIVALSGSALLVVLSIVNQVMTRKPLAHAAEEMARTHAIVEAGRRSAETLRAMGMADAHRARWLGEHRVAMSRQLQANDIASGFSIAIKIGRLLLQSLILGTGAYLSLNDAMSPGAMIASSIIATRALAPIEQLISQWRSLINVTGAVQRCRKNLEDAEPQQERLALPDPQGALQVSKLYVAAPGKTDPVLKGLDFRLEPGDAVAVIGPSAAGKSSLARALVGVWPIRHGEVRLDGAELDQWDPQHLGKHIGYLPQDTTLFDGTIVENIARLSPDPDPRAVLAAANAAGVHEMILRLEDGYGTRVGEGGVALSGGQRQRIALARALYGNPALIVMDEPNANLDAEGEAALVAAIKRARQAKQTVVVMAHRQSVLAAVNRVLVLKEGRQIAFGEPTKVLRKPRAQNDTEPRHDSKASAQLATQRG